MDYDQFDAEYGRLLDAAGSLSPAALAAEVDQLRALVDSIPSPTDQEAARLLMSSLDDALAVSVPELSAAMTEAVQVHTRARTAQGTPLERIEQLRAGIDAIGRIADTAEPAEQGTILNLNESLYLLVESLEITAGPGPT